MKFPAAFVTAAAVTIVGLEIAVLACSAPHFCGLDLGAIIVVAAAFSFGAASIAAAVLLVLAGLLVHAVLPLTPGRWMTVAAIATGVLAAYGAAAALFPADGGACSIISGAAL